MAAIFTSGSLLTDRSTPADAERIFTNARVEIRSAAGSRTIGGLAAVFNQRSHDLGFGYEQVHPQFFNESAAAGYPGVVCRWNHDSFHLLGSVTGRTLRLSVTPQGLDYSVDLPEHRNDLLELVARQDVSQSSFAFTQAKDDWDYRDARPVRTLLSGRLIDVAPVDVAAYPTGTSAALRSLARWAEAPISDVLERAERNELRGFFTRTDRPSVGRRPMSGAVAKAYIMGRRWPDDSRYREPQQRRPMSGALAKTIIMGKRWPELEQRPPMSGRAARLYLMTRRPFDPIVPRRSAWTTRDPRRAKLLLHAHRIAGGW